MKKRSPLVIVLGLTVYVVRQIFRHSADMAYGALMLYTYHVPTKWTYFFLILGTIIRVFTVPREQVLVIQKRVEEIKAEIEKEESNESN